MAALGRHNLPFGSTTRLRLGAVGLADAFGRAAEHANFTPCWDRFFNAGNHLLPAQLRNSIWDRSVKLSGFYRSGARHISATDLTQYLLADLIVRVGNTGFSYASPGPLGS